MPRGHKGVTRQGTKSSKGDRLIIVDAITSDGAIRWQLENKKKVNYGLRCGPSSIQNQETTTLP